MALPFKDQMRITQEYHSGHRAVDCTGNARPGIVPLTPDVLCVQEGKVIQSRIVTNKGDLTWQWGNYVCVQTPNGEKHYYCHLASRAVKVGQKVRVGDKLGVMGNSGYSFGAHLHFERRDKNGKQLDPTPLLGIPNKKGTYYADQPTQQQEDDEMKIGVYSKSNEAVRSAALKDGAIALMQNGELVVYRRRIVREVEDATLSKAYEDLRYGEMAEGDIIAVTEN